MMSARLRVAWPAEEGRLVRGRGHTTYNSVCEKMLAVLAAGFSDIRQLVISFKLC